MRTGWPAGQARPSDAAHTGPRPWVGPPPHRHSLPGITLQTWADDGQVAEISARKFRTVDAPRLVVRVAGAECRGQKGAI